MTEFQKNVKKALTNSSDVFADRLTTHKNGTVSVKRAYFYTHGNTAEKWAEKVMSVLPNARLVEVRNDYRQWPTQSYFVAVVGPQE
jgi:hypothetical protein